jgi:hypothetical protein
MPAGGRFAAMEVPEHPAADTRKFAMLMKHSRFSFVYDRYTGDSPVQSGKEAFANIKNHDQQNDDRKDQKIRKPFGSAPFSFITHTKNCSVNLIDYELLLC